MATWKELGEVPDSDDESALDSQESEPAPPPQIDICAPDGIDTEIPVPGVEDENRHADRRDGSEIWDIPFSSQASGENQVAARPPTPEALPPTSILKTDTPAPAPLRPLSIFEDLNNDFEEDLEDTVQPAEQNDSRSARVEVALQLLPEDVRREYVEATYEVEHNAANDENADDDDNETSLQEAIRLGRSLRPRKPIQEHPYLLESAQYSKTLKSHGVRPLRMRIEEALRRKKQEEEDSQEQDYEEDSQVTAKDTAQDDTEESQGIRDAGLLDEADLLPLSSDGRPSPSPPASRQADMLRSSQDDEEEFPDPADVEKWKANKRPYRRDKRRASPKVSSKRKIPRVRDPVGPLRETPPAPLVDDVFDIPPSPPQTSPALLGTTPMTAFKYARHGPITLLTPKPSSTISSRGRSPTPADQTRETIDLTMAGDEDNTNDEPGGSSGSGSESESEPVRAAVKRMRGVLPASWLRLDQQRARPKPGLDTRQRSPDPSPERNHRKGVAQRRQVSPKPGHDAALSLDDDDDDDANPQQDDTGSVPRYKPVSIFEDDAGSVIEEDEIDRMVFSNKRASTNAIGSERPKKRRKDQPSTFKGVQSRRKRQQKITGVLGRSKSTKAKSNGEVRRSTAHASARGNAKDYRNRKVATPPPPRLSILDVVDANAPPFIRIAARTANKRRDQGRSSPSRKHIMLGTRKDNIDAVEVLTSWKRGITQPKILPKRATTQSRINIPEPLRAVSHNTVVQPSKAHSKPRSRGFVPSARFSQPRRMVQQTSLDNFVNVEAEGPTTAPSLHHAAPRNTHSKKQNASLRPAQLETAGEPASRHTFITRKRALDAVYRKSRKALPAPTNVRLERFVDSHVPTAVQDHPIETSSPTEDTDLSRRVAAQRRPRARKQAQPRPLDVTAPQYAHANDPLPRAFSPLAEIVNVTEGGGKLLGLGPFGTHYTQHFEVFPLDPGVFFHESTFLGSGRLLKTLDEKSIDASNHPRARQTFTLDEKTLLWGQWDAQTSSEFGIIFDWIADNLYADSLSDMVSKSSVRAIEFILEYLQDSISFIEPESQSLFTGRALEVLQTFARRIETFPDKSHDRRRPFIEVSTRALVVTLHVLRISQNANQLLSEAFQLEELLKRISKAIAQRLLSTNLVDIRALYDDLQHMSFRERGIRNERYSAISWVTIIRVLEEARIPRSGFWDIVSPVLLSHGTDLITDTHTFERVWHNLFLLLPLGEFDNGGVVLQGIRHRIPLEGWSIPQRLLKRVFQVYQSNSRQSPSFNDYCRALVSRCYFLVEQWGWRKGNTVVGTIFDFFAAQDLSHLRNEEVYQSPQFLERLAESPSLAILPEDRCFHIFLKLLALTIKRLRKFGLVKDVRNLVTRVLPNHNRQHDKEKDTHETEMAALRNHHDLLCTLFWAAPVELRPSPQNIEKLVVPGSSHKEACLISLRAWSQLSRFVVSSSEDVSAYRPFADWQRSVFQQVLGQYMSVESDVQQQLLRMSKDTSRTISQDWKNAVIKTNKTTAMDILHFSMKAVLDVMRYTRTLGAASFVMNHYQLDQAFSRLSFTSAESDWGMLRVSLDVLGYYLTRIKEFGHQPAVNADHSWHGEDAIMLLERKLAVPFLATVRGLVGVGFKDFALGPTSDRALCVEQAVCLAGRLAVCLIHARLSRVSQFFASGKYHVFQDLSKPVSSPSRKYTALFLATLMEEGLTEFKDIGMTSLDLFLCEIVKPFDYLAYENRLAMAMKRQGDPYLEAAVIETGNSPDYNSNRDLFNYTLTAMRKALRYTDTAQKQPLQTQFAKSLRFTMDRMKLDLKSMAQDSSAHMNHIAFVRSIISLIRSQDMCPVDSFFYQISREYSPSTQDPRLQTAGILAWGLKLEEGDTKAASGLFYLLFPSFKLALANGKLTNEKEILQQGMKNTHVFSFMLSIMFPAIIKAAVQEPKGWVLLETYTEAFQAQLAAACIHREIGPGSMVHVLNLMKIMLTGVQHLQSRDVFELRPEHLVILRLMISILNLVSPSLAAYLINEASSPTAPEIIEVIDALTDFTRAGGRYLSELLEETPMEQAIIVDPSHLFGAIRGPGAVSSPEHSEHINRFASHMVQDINNNWTSDDSVITVRGPSRPQQGPSATQSGQGTRLPGWKAGDLVRGLNEQLREWNYHNDTTKTAATASGAVPLDDFLF
ncbi:Uu.00g063630.m01.CDS01 [Anthostomella pinea]|uniref:Uu.00g063630.m01.CDS01 n=1 Tax=Anthostomella pinea TaxID=933095 RepID=A0AAI8VUM8_9PEZI|nr:Uu.00g063630.m01.CDS01 [Anthostomella pinea]